MREQAESQGGGGGALTLTAALRAEDDTQDAVVTEARSHTFAVPQSRSREQRGQPPAATAVANNTEDAVGSPQPGSIGALVLYGDTQTQTQTQPQPLVASTALALSAGTNPLGVLLS